MRRFILLLGVLSWVSGVSDASAQGTVNFNTRVPQSGVDAPVFVLSPGGPRATGPTYVAQLLAGPVGGPLEPVGAPVALRGTPATLAGYLVGGEVTIPNIPPGGPASVQFLVWESTMYRTAEEVLGPPRWPPPNIGLSVVITLPETGDPTDSPPGAPVDLVGLAVPIVIGRTPEPSLAVLGLLGGVLLVCGKQGRR